MSISVSMLNRSILPRTRSLMRGCETPKSAAAAACVSLRASISLRISIMSSDRSFRCSASSRSKPRSRNTFPEERRILVVIASPPCPDADASDHAAVFAPRECRPAESGASASRTRGARIHPPHTSRYRRPGTQPRHGLGPHTPPHPRPPWASSHSAQDRAVRDPTGGLPPASPPSEGSDVLRRRPEPKQALLRHGLIYKFLYAGQSPKSLQDPFLPELT